MAVCVARLLPCIWRSSLYCIFGPVMVYTLSCDSVELERHQISTSAEVDVSQALGRVGRGVVSKYARGNSLASTHEFLSERIVEVI